MKRLVRSFTYGEKGFTLIELLVVIAILGVLSAIAVPILVGVMNRGNLSAARAEAATLQTAVDAALADSPPVVPSSPVGPLGAGTLIPYLRGALRGTYTITALGVITGTASGFSNVTIWANNTWHTVAP